MGPRIEADAGRPADGEDNANQQRGRIAGATGSKIEAFLPVQERYPENAGQVQAEDHQDDAADLAQ